MMPTTKIKLDPSLALTIKAVKQAHNNARAPGSFLALLPESGQYYVQTVEGIQKHSYTESQGKLTVFCSVSGRLLKAAVAI